MNRENNVNNKKNYNNKLIQLLTYQAHFYLNNK